MWEDGLTPSKITDWRKLLPTLPSSVFKVKHKEEYFNSKTSQRSLQNFGRGWENLCLSLKLAMTSHELENRREGPGGPWSGP